MQLKFQFNKAANLPREEVATPKQETARQQLPGSPGLPKTHPPPDDPWESIGYNKRRA